MLTAEEAQDRYTKKGIAEAKRLKELQDNGMRLSVINKLRWDEKKKIKLEKELELRDKEIKKFQIQEGIDEDSIRLDEKDEYDKKMASLGVVNSKLDDSTVKESIDLIAKTHHNPIEFMDSLISWESVLRDNKNVSTASYVKAVHFCSLRAAELSVRASYIRTFPEKCVRKNTDGDWVTKPEGTIAALAHSYGKTKMVQNILAQLQIPLHIMMMGERVKMATKLAELALTADSERVQMESADRLLNHITAPDVQKVELDVDFKGTEVLTDISASLDAFAELAVNRIKAGTMTATQVIEHNPHG